MFIHNLPTIPAPEPGLSHSLVAFGELNLPIQVGLTPASTGNTVETIESDFGFEVLEMIPCESLTEHSNQHPGYTGEFIVYFDCGQKLLVRRSVFRGTSAFCGNWLICLAIYFCAAMCSSAYSNTYCVFVDF